MELVRAVCASAVYIEHGRVQQYGNAADVIDGYHQVLDRRRVEKLDLAWSSSPVSKTQLEITKIEIRDNNGQSVDDLYSDQPVEVRVNYIAYRTLGKANLVVRVYRVDGVSCCVVRTSLDNFDVFLSQGEGTISVTLDPIQLYGGTYYVVAWIMDAEDINGIVRGSSDWFQVKNRVPGRESQDAIFEPSRRWRHFETSPHHYISEGEISDKRISSSTPLN
jgi:hypothetical protein